MLKPIALSNAVTSVFIISYVVCIFVAFIAPDLYFGSVSSLLHSFNLDSIKATTPMSLPTVVFGIVSYSIYVWIATFATAKAYKFFAKSK